MERTTIEVLFYPLNSTRIFFWKICVCNSYDALNRFQSLYWSNNTLNNLHWNAVTSDINMSNNFVERFCHKYFQANPKKSKEEIIKKLTHLYLNGRKLVEIVWQPVSNLKIDELFAIKKKTCEFVSNCRAKYRVNNSKCSIYTIIPFEK